MNNDNLGKLKLGEKKHFAELVRNHHHALIALAIPIVGRSEAEEVVQSAWLKAYKAITKFEGKSAVRTWLSRIVINEAKMQLRSRKGELLFADMGDDHDNHDALTDHFSDNGSWKNGPAHWHVDSPDGLLMRSDLERCLAQLLAQLPANQRAMLEMRDSSGIPFDDICNELSISASNARVLLHRARTELFKLVNHYQETGEC